MKIRRLGVAVKVYDVDAPSEAVTLEDILGSGANMCECDLKEVREYMCTGCRREAIQEFCKKYGSNYKLVSLMAEYAVLKDYLDRLDEVIFELTSTSMHEITTTDVN
jgi:hypothetical protein